MSDCQSCPEQSHLNSATSLVPDITNDCPTQSGNPECSWPSEDEIRAELLWARYPRQREIDRFVELGVKASALYVSGPVVVDQVVFQDNGLFEFGRYAADKNKQNAFILEVRGIDGPIDLAAWDPDGDRCALWLGRGFALGEDQIWFPVLSGTPLPIWRSPLGWLRAGRTGLVIIRSTATPFYLRDVVAVSAEDSKHLSEIQEMLKLRRPWISVRVAVCDVA